MTLHPEIKKFLQSPLADPFSNIKTNFKQIRSIVNNLPEAEVEGLTVSNVEDRLIRGKDCDIPIRIYTPFETKPFPTLIFFHGGGFVTGSITGKDRTCRKLALETGHKVISVGYRLAPENPFPAATEDCYEATKWVYEHSQELQADTAKISVMGTSAGGNLATVVSMMLRDRGGPNLNKQILVYPVTDFFQEGVKTPYRSYEINGEGYYLTRKSMDGFWSLYLKNREDSYDSYACPIRAKNLSNLPPAFIITAEFDPVRDEGEAYGKRLEASNNVVKVKRYKGVIHGFLKFENIEQTKDVYLQIRQFLKNDCITPSN